MRSNHAAPRRFAALGEIDPIDDSHDDLHNTAAAPAPAALSAGARRAHRARAGLAVALSAGAALPDRQPGLDPDAVALGDRREGGTELRADRPHGGEPAGHRHRVGRWALLQSP